MVGFLVGKIVAVMYEWRYLIFKLKHVCYMYSDIKYSLDC